MASGSLRRPGLLERSELTEGEAGQDRARSAEPGRRVDLGPGAPSLLREGDGHVPVEGVACPPLRSSVAPGAGVTGAVQAQCPS